MTIQKKFLVLVDGSERSIQTVHYLVNFMPVDADTRIVLFHVFCGMPKEYRELKDNPTCHNALQQLKIREAEQEVKNRVYLEQMKKILITGGFSEQSIEIKFRLLNKGVARDIIEEAKNGYSAVFLRRRGMGALKRIILGSVAVKLLQSLTFIPIVFVGRTPPVKKILLAVDTSPSSMKAVEFVASQLGGYGYQACILHVIRGLGAVHFDFSEVNMPELSEVDMSDDTCLEALKIKLSQLFQDIQQKLIASGFESEKVSEKIVSGVSSRSEAIITEAEAGCCDTIVVGRRGLSKSEAFFMGRVGHKVVYGGNQFTVWVV